MDRFLRWARGLLGMSAIWGAATAIASTVVGVGAALWTGEPVLDVAVMVFGIFGALGLVSGAVFGAILSLTASPDSDRLPVLPMTAAGALIGAMVMFGFFLMTTAGAPGFPGILWLLGQSTTELGLAGIVGGLVGGGVTHAANRAEPQLVAGEAEGR